MSYEKKINGILLARLAVMLIWCAPAAAATRNLTAAVVTGNVGDTVSVPITVDDATGIGGIAFTIGYDPNAFTFVNLVQDQKTPFDNGSGASYTTDQLKTSLFYQFNDEKVANAPTGRVLVAAATADGLTGANLRLFKAQFTIKAGAAGVYPIQLMGTIIANPSAGYATPQFIPILVGTSDKNTITGMYTTTVFPTIASILSPGSIGVSISGKAISGKAYYGADTTLPAVGCTVILKKTAMGGVGFVFDSQTTVSSTGAFAFANKPAGSYQVSIQPLDPGYLGSGDLAVTMPTVPADVAMTDVHLAAATTYQRYTGTVSVYYPGMQLQVFAAGNSTTPIGIYPVGADKTWATGLMANGSYTFYVVYGTLKAVATAGGPTDLSAWSLKKISGTIAGLPTDAIVTIMAGSTTAGVQKMLRQPVGATGSYQFADLVPASDYIVAMAGAGKPLTYYNMVTDITTATFVDISAGDQTAVNFNFGSTTTGKISGTVVEGTVPVIGIAVYAFDTVNFALTQAVTDASGAFTFTLIPGTYELFVIKANGKIFYYNQTLATQSEADATPITVATTELTGNNINIAECTNSLSGTVTFKREGGDPAANILITAFSDTNSSKAAAITGPDGGYTLTGLCGVATYNVIMQPLLGRYAVQKKTTAIPATAALNFVIDSGSVLSGTVKDDVGTGNNVDNAMIYLLDQATGTLINNRMYFSAAGQYEVGDVATGVYTLKGSHPDYPTYTKSDLPISTDTVQNITFTKGARFTGTVTEAGPIPVANALVIVTRVGEVPVSVITNSAGKYAVYGLSELNSDYTIIVQKKDYLRQSVQNQTPGTSTNGTVVDFTLAKPAATFDLTGTVSKSGGAGPVANVWVMLTANNGAFFVSTLTNVSGGYGFTKLPQANDYRLVVMPGGNLPAYVESPIDWSAASGTVTKNVTIAWGDTTKISGTVTRTGSGAISVFLYKAADNSFVAFTTAGSDGSYAFQGLATGTYKVLAVCPGNSPKWYGGATIDAATAVSTGTTTANITLAP